MAPTAPRDSYPSAADLRASLARANVPRYQVAAHAQVNPSTFSGLLNGRLPLSPEMANRIAVAIAHCSGGVQ